jgi:hypothetical protein
MALDNESLSGGPFSLASYTNLNPVEQVALSIKPADPANWNRIEVSYSRTASGTVGQLAKSNGLTSSTDLNFHFVICNGVGATDGRIQATEKWRMQRPCLPGGNWYGTGQTIRVCVVADGFKILPTDCQVKRTSALTEALTSQVKRTSALTEALTRKFDISSWQISYPASWQL